MDESLSGERTRHISVDLIRTVAIVGVVLLHAGNDLINGTQAMDNMEILRWWSLTAYQTFGRLGVPLFIMVTGALLLVPSKANEGLDVFFKKRFTRIGLPTVFWGVAYFLWDIYVENQKVTQGFIVQGILTGPYLQFWYIYMIIGLYLLTPFLRIIVAHANQQLFKYFFVVWFAMTTIPPFIKLFTKYTIDTNILTIPAFVGYFILGVYLVRVQVSRRILVAVLGTCMALTAVGTYFVARIFGGTDTWFFQEYVSPTTIIAAISFFLLLNTVKLKSETQPAHRSLGGRILHVISENTLGIFFMHLMVLYVLHVGIGGYALNGNTVYSAIGVPLATGLTILICLAIIVPLKKIPVIKRLIT